MAKRSVIKAFKREFEDNESFATFTKLRYMEPLAQVVEDVLYSEKAEGDDEYGFGVNNFRLDGRIDLCDFMTLCVFFISAAKRSHGRATIQGHIGQMEYADSFSLDGLKVHYTNDGNGLWIENADHTFTVAVLWASYVYCRARKAGDDSWKKAEDLLYALSKEKLRMSDRGMKSQVLFSQTKDALSMLGTLIIEEIKSRAEKQGEGPATKAPETSSPQQPQSDDAQKECEKLRAELESVKTELEKRTKELEEVRNSMKTENDKALYANKVRLELALRFIELSTDNLTVHGRPAAAGRLLHKITGISERTCAKYPTERGEFNKIKEEYYKAEFTKIDEDLQKLGASFRFLDPAPDPSEQKS